MLAYARGSVRRRWFENEDGSIRLTLEGPHARLRSVQVRFLRRQPQRRARLRAVMGAMVFHRIYILCNAASLRLQSVPFS
jgi:hypothetical protein